MNSRPRSNGGTSHKAQQHSSSKSSIKDPKGTENEEKKYGC